MLGLLVADRLYRQLPWVGSRYYPVSVSNSVLVSDLKREIEAGRGTYWCISQQTLYFDIMDVIGVEVRMSMCDTQLNVSDYLNRSSWNPKNWRMTASIAIIRP